jgi:Cu/Ag efflux protein CusF
MTARNIIATVLTSVMLAAAAPAAEVRGVLSKVDLDKNEITLEGRGKGARGMTFTFVVDPDTKVMFGDQAGTLKDLSPGKHVRVIYETRGDRTVALTIKGFALFAPAVPAVPAGTPPRADPGAVTGTLQRVAYTEREIVVVGPGAQGPETETTFRVPGDVKITRGDKAQTLDDLKEGERVAVTAEKRDGKLTATAIQVGDAAPQAPKKESRLQRILEIAGRVMQMAEKMRENRP